MKIFVRGNKQDYFVVMLAGILVVIVFVIVYFAFTQKPTPKENQTSFSTPTPIEITISPLPLQYDNAAEDRLAKELSQRPPLSSADSQQKATMLNTILHGFNSGVLYESGDVRIEYVQSADMLMVEIKTTNIVKAKAEATNWILGQGISQDGMCKLPVMFYLDPQVTQELQGQDVIFSPLPNNC